MTLKGAVPPIYVIFPGKLSSIWRIYRTVAKWSHLDLLWGLGRRWGKPWNILRDMGEGKERGPPIIFTNYNLVARFVWLTNFISFSLFFHFQTIIRKREVVISRVSVYIVVILVSCHTIRIIPNVWEIVQTFTKGKNGSKVNNCIYYIGYNAFIFNLPLNGF